MSMVQERDHRPVYGKRSLGEWDDNKTELLKQLWMDGVTVKVIARRLDMRASQVCMKRFTLDLPRRGEANKGDPLTCSVSSQLSKKEFEAFARMCSSRGKSMSSVLREMVRTSLRNASN